MNPVRIRFMREKMEEVARWEESTQAVREKRKGKEVTLPSRFLNGLDVLDVGSCGGLLSEVGCSLHRLEDA